MNCDFNAEVNFQHANGLG